METNNEISISKVHVANLEDLSDLEELESKQAPCEPGAGIRPFSPCHNHNETLLHDDIGLAELLGVELDVEELERKEAPGDLWSGCHNHNETLVCNDFSLVTPPCD